MASTYLGLYIHVIFATQGRAPTIDSAWRQDLHAFLGATAKTFGVKPLAVGGVADHVHLLLSINATASVSELVREVKKASNRWATERFSRFAWQSGYAAFSVSPDAAPKVAKYIGDQERHHRSISSAEELRSLLIELGVEFDERYFE